MITPTSLKIAAAEEVLSAIPAGETLVFTNGCFDILHPGNVDSTQIGRASCRERV